MIYYLRQHVLGKFSNISAELIFTITGVDLLFVIIFTL